jgi:hypothetical protein
MRSLTVDPFSKAMVVSSFVVFFEKGGKSVIFTLIFSEKDLRGISLSSKLSFKGAPF